MRRIILLAPLALAACVAPPPAPAPRPIPMPPPPVARPAPTPPPMAWQDGPAAPGNWRWTRDAQGSTATFGIVGQDPAFVARCDTARRTIALSVPGTATAGATLTIQTSDGARTFPAAPTTTPAATTAYVGATIPAADGFLDRIAFSRGRFRVQLTGGEPVVIPAWPEFTRTVEDCRA